MRIPRIYSEEPLRADTNIQLAPGPSQHIARVLRMQPGHQLILFDGSGGQYPAVLDSVDKKGVVVATGALEKIERESCLELHLGIAISRGERMDWVVQKATELGVSTISPLLSERTEVRLGGERAQKKLRHWRQIAISACEQCGRNQLPGIQPLRALEDWIHEARADLKLVLHPVASRLDMAAAPASVALLVGPEGGLTDTEIASAERSGFHSLQLGPRILRTETAPLAAIAILQARWGDMSGQF